jgi:hypothetical protein
MQLQRQQQVLEVVFSFCWLGGVLFGLLIVVLATYFLLRLIEL